MELNTDMFVNAILSFVFVVGGMKVGLNGLKGTVKDIALDIKEINQTVSHLSARISVLEDRSERML